MRKLANYSFFLVIALTILLSFKVYAQDKLPDVKAVQEALLNNLDKLELDDDTRLKVEKILLESGQERQAILESYGGKPSELNFRKKIKLKREMEAVQAKTNEQLAAHLSQEQLEKLHIMRQEQLQRLRN